MDPEEPTFLVTERQRVILRLLVEAGIRESGADINDQRFEDVRLRVWP
jgi:hypothetical protein